MDNSKYDLHVTAVTGMPVSDKNSFLCVVQMSNIIIAFTCLLTKNTANLSTFLFFYIFSYDTDSHELILLLYSAH